MLVEASIVYIIAIFLIVGVMSLGLGIFRYQQLAWLSAECARWASVHGSTYQSEQSAAAITSTDIYNNVVKPNQLLLDSKYIGVSLTMTSGVATVTLTYNWTPEFYLSAITMRAKAACPITY